MKWSEIVNLVSDYQSAQYSDEYTEVRPGCDCGCGGEYYSDNPDAWYEMVEFNQEAIKSVKEFCKQQGIEYDGID